SHSAIIFAASQIDWVGATSFTSRVITSLTFIVVSLSNPAACRTLPPWGYDWPPGAMFQGRAPIAGRAIGCRTHPTLARRDPAQNRRLGAPLLHAARVPPRGFLHARERGVRRRGRVPRDAAPDDAVDGRLPPRGRDRPRGLRLRRAGWTHRAHAPPAFGARAGARLA